MFRIDKLEMQGFKSFAKKTTLLLPSNFSVICGPNGSGKSNILDSICFVLGRTSAKSLRADRMHEMIFNGGSNKQPAEAAKVAIFFDNSDKTLPIEDSSVVVSRTVNRKGVSIYKLNGKTVTREKVLEVLRAARITPDGHNIILQGDINEIIEMSPLDRREIIDEVSGIAEFDAKRERAQRELATVEERLKEAAIVLNERSALLEKLEKEAASAESYKALTAELDKLRASLAKMRLMDAETAMKQLEKGIQEREKNLDDFDKKIAEIDQELAKNEIKLTKLGDALLDRSGDIAVAREIERLRAEIARRKDMINNNYSSIRQLENIIAQLEAMQARSLESSPAVREVLKLGRSGVYGTIASLSKVPTQYQTAIEVCAGPHLWDIVVSDENVAIECINHLKRGRIGRATFLPLDKIKEREAGHLKKYLKQPGVIGLAIDLIDFDKKYWHAFSFVFGDTLVVDKIETARRIGIGNARMVTLEGDLVERSGAIIGGFYRSDSKAFTGTDQITNYTKQKEQLAADITKLEHEITELEAKLTKLIEQEAKGGEKLKSDLNERAALEQTISSLRLQRKEFAEAKLTADAEIQNLRIKKAKLEALLENVKAEFANYAVVKDIYNDKKPQELENKINETIAAINKLGPVNQRAPQELEELKPAYTELKQRVET
ncbi:MAG: AAA family ATPase, partial [Candidatus Aenigmarchaeota archaeon]|nr:AAA family ATPase [Candidatus Aenigmarchaeota archaeon]